MSGLTPARLVFRDDGTPCSEDFGDVYHPSAGALEQARHVFLRGNRLPQRWQQRPRFCILETGFGLGLNFLATWAAWRADPARCASLHYFSAELHPFRPEDLHRVHRQHPELEALADELLASWPPLVPGFHRLHLDQGRVILTLLFGDARALLPQVEGRFDAFYLDGFSPARNPELWNDALIARLAQQAAPGATLATWSVSGKVRRALAQAGFAWRKEPGFAGKREMLTATFAPVSDAPTFTSPPDANLGAVPADARHAIVVGAGLAGSAIVHRLAERGWQIDVIDSATTPGQGASGNRAGVLRPVPNLADTALARITRAAALYGMRHLARFGRDSWAPRFDPCGVLHLARDAAQNEKMRQVVTRHACPPDYLRHVGRDEASAIAGCAVSEGGWWFPWAGWVQPPSLCAAHIAAFSDGVRLHGGRTVAALKRRGAEWFALDEQGRTIASAPTLILANGTGIRTFPHAAPLPVLSARGQVTHLADDSHTPRVVLCRSGYLSPPVDGIRSVGATFDMDDDCTQLRDSDEAANLTTFQAMLPDQTLPAIALDRGRVGFRPASPDRLPLVGGVPVAGQTPPNTMLDAVERVPGLYVISGFGARGLVWSALMAELLASRLHGDPLPLERELVDAMDPARFTLRPFRKKGTRSNKQV